MKKCEDYKSKDMCEIMGCGKPNFLDYTETPEIEVFKVYTKEDKQIGVFFDKEIADKICKILNLIIKL